MKTLAAAVLLIAVSAWGQSKPATSKAWVYSAHVDSQSAVAIKSCTDPHYISIYADSGMTIPMANPLRPDRNGDYTIFLSVPCIEVLPSHGHPYEVMSPHKLKPSVTCAGKECLVSSHIDPCDGWACTKPVEELHWSCLGDCGGVPEGTKWEIIPFNAPYPYPDHILQADVLSQPDKATGDCFRGNVGHEKQIPCPDKAAVPVEPSCSGVGDGIVCSTNEAAEPITSDFFDVHQYGEPKCPNGMTCLFVHVSSNPLASQIESASGSAVKLSDSEYSHLQQLRASVVEEEKRLAVKYGANRGFDYCSGDLSAMKAVGCFADEYEFHGQFLLIDKGGK